MPRRSRWLLIYSHWVTDRGSCMKQIAYVVAQLSLSSRLLSKRPAFRGESGVGVRGAALLGSSEPARPAWPTLSVSRPCSPFSALDTGVFFIFPFFKIKYRSPSIFSRQVGNCGIHTHSFSHYSQYFSCTFCFKILN